MMKIEDDLLSLKIELAQEMVDQGLDTESAAFIAAGMRQESTLKMMMDYLISIREEMIPFLELISKAREIEILNGEKGHLV